MFVEIDACVIYYFFKLVIVVLRLLVLKIVSRKVAALFADEVIVLTIY